MYYKSIMYGQLANLIQFSSEDTIGASFKGAIYRKQLAKFGDWVNPQYPLLSNNPIMTLDEDWGNKIVENFNNNILGHSVAVPSTHTNDPEKNRGKVISVDVVPGDGLYGELEILEDTTVQALDKGTIFDVSISFSHDYVRKDDNKHYGPTLEHVALVNDPYLSEMNTFEKLEMALSKQVDSNSVKLAGNNVIMLSIDKMKELSKMTTKIITNRVKEKTANYANLKVEDIEIEEAIEFKKSWCFCQRKYPNHKRHFATVWSRLHSVAWT